MKTMRMVLSALALLGLTAVGSPLRPRGRRIPPPEVSVRNECVDGIRMPGCTWGPMG